MINKQKFFDLVRTDRALFPNGLAQSAVVTLEALIDEFHRRNMTDLRHLAYPMATARGEVGAAMAPVREGFSTTDAQARAYVKRNFPHYSMIINGHMYYGRGLVQLTWHRNYVVMSNLLGIDLEGNPDLALEPEIAVQIMFEGMTRGVSGKGDFTGKALEDYFNDRTEDWVNARRIINGTDKAATFAAWGRRFHEHLKAAYEAVPVYASKQPVPDAEPVESFSPFRKVLGWVNAAYGFFGSLIGGVGAWFAGLPTPVAIALVAGVLIAVVGIFALIWLYPRPIVITRK